MGRTAIAAQTPLGPYPGSVSAGALALTFTAADTTNNNEFALSGHEVLVAQNTDAADQTITLHSTADSRGRTADIATYSIPAGAFAFFSFLAGTEGWIESDGNCYIDASSANVKFAVLYCKR